MPGMDGLELLSRITRDHPGLPVVVITAHATVETTVQALRLPGSMAAVGEQGGESRPPP